MKSSTGLSLFLKTANSVAKPSLFCFADAIWKLAVLYFADINQVVGSFNYQVNLCGRLAMFASPGIVFSVYSVNAKS